MVLGSGWRLRCQPGNQQLFRIARRRTSRRKGLGVPGHVVCVMNTRLRSIRGRFALNALRSESNPLTRTAGLSKIPRVPSGRMPITG